MKMEKVLSPITKKQAVFISKESTLAIREGYLSFLGIDIKNQLEGKEISLYKCQDTSYKFYHPSSLAGDDKFYKNLSKISWYYQDWKFEYDIASKLINEGSSVLEVGCGKGAFLNYLKQNRIQATGLELNDIAIEEAKKKELNVIRNTVEEHAHFNSEKYDFVISFQVLEHIYEVDSFLKACIRCLKKGGKLIIAVPDNDALFFKMKKKVSFEGAFQQRTLLLNQPPHHMGLWNQKSLNKTFRMLGLMNGKFYSEPLPEYRSGLVAELIVGKIIPSKFKSIYKYKVFLLTKFIRRFRKYIKGDSVVAVFQK